MTLIEKMAKAMAEAGYVILRSSNMALKPEEKMGALELANSIGGLRTALVAAREPTKAMMQGFYGDRHDLASEQDMDKHWGSAIDVALSEGK